jgi:crotonobetainyl-CoA:carnitine CoA-transferase CaiB-like acyl-CoA transferase
LTLCRTRGQASYIDDLISNEVASAGQAGQVGPLPLSGVSVLDIGGPLSAYASKLLADFGADVLKVEPPAGDELRRSPPLRGDGESLLFAYYHGNKRGIRLDVSKPAAEPLLTELAADCDIVVLTPSVHRPVTGLDAGDGRLSWAAASAIVCCLTPFGLAGPLSEWRMTPLTSFAMSGLMYKMGERDEPPAALPGRQAWDELGAHAVIALLAALRAGPAGRGQTLDLAVHDCLSGQDDVINRYSVTGVIWQRGGSPSYPPGGPWDCRDGKIEFQVHTERHWAGFVAMLDHPAELAAPALAQRLVRLEHADALRRDIARLLADRSRYELVERGQAAGVPCGLLNTVAQFTSDEQVLARELVASRPHAALGEVRMPGQPFVSSRPLTAFRRPAPRLGEHDDEVYRLRLGHTADDLARWRGEGLA